MKVLTVSNCRLIESQGSGYVILNFCRRLRDRGHEVDLFGPESYEVLTSLKKAGGFRRAIGMLWLTLKQIRKKQYDIVEFYGGEAWLIAWILSWMPKRRFLLVSHSNGFETHNRDMIDKYLSSMAPDGCSPRKWYHFNQKSLYEKAFTCVDGIVTVGQFDRSYGLSHNYRQASQIVSIDNSLPADYLGLKNNFQRAPIIGYCGSWISRKGVEVIRDDITRLLDEFPDWSLKVIGAGSNFRKEDYFPRHLHARIEAVPFVETREELRDLYQSLAIILMPSIYESFGLVTAEAMACGVAVVATNVGFASGLKHGEEVMLMKEPRSPYLYENVRQLVVDSTLRQRIAERGYHRVQNLSWDSAIETLDNTYANWLTEFTQQAS